MLEDSSKTVVTVMGLKRKAEAELPADFSAAQNIGTVALQKSESFSDAEMDVCDAKSVILSSPEKDFGSSSNSPSGSTHDADFHEPKSGTVYTRPNHSQVEKRRRHTINKLIDELATVLPIGSSSNRKPDKLTVLKMAVQHLQLYVHAEKRPCNSALYKPLSMKEEEMQMLLEGAAAGFIFVVGTDRYQILNISDKVLPILGYSAADLVGKRLLDLVHAKDITTLKDQLMPPPPPVAASGFHSLPTGSESGADSKEPVCAIYRRSFFCRMRHNRGQSDDGQGKQRSALRRPKAKSYHLTDDDMKDYSIIHCTGYLKSWLLPATQQLPDVESFSICYFYAIAQRVNVFSEAPPEAKGSVESLEFTCRCSIDGRILCVDPRIVSIMGHLPQDLIGQTYYDLVQPEDANVLQKAMANVARLKSAELVFSDSYRIMAKSGYLVSVVTALFNFRNPLTDEIEFVCMQSSVVE